MTYSRRLRRAGAAFGSCRRPSSSRFRRRGTRFSGRRSHLDGGLVGECVHPAVGVPRPQMVLLAMAFAARGRSDVVVPANVRRFAGLLHVTPAPSPAARRAKGEISRRLIAPLPHRAAAGVSADPTSPWNRLCAPAYSMHRGHPSTANLPVRATRATCQRLPQPPVTRRRPTCQPCDA